MYIRQRVGIPAKTRGSAVLMRAVVGNFAYSDWPELVCVGETMQSGCDGLRLCAGDKEPRHNVLRIELS